MLTRNALIEHIDKWADIVRGQAILLYDNGAAPEHVLKLAIQIADSKMQRATVEQQERQNALLGGVRGVNVRQ